MAPQCGLAPGLIGIVGSSLAEGLTELRRMQLRVGALPQHPTGVLGYAFTWSPEGVVNEYLNDCEVIRERAAPDGAGHGRHRDGRHRRHPARGLRHLGRARHAVRDLRGPHPPPRLQDPPLPGPLRRHPLPARRAGAARPAGAGRARSSSTAKPPVDDDVVYLYAAVEGIDDGTAWPGASTCAAGTRSEIAGRWWRAISWTTAASACGVVELVARGKVPGTGFLRQEDVALADLLATTTGSLFADPADEVG